jgi:DNA repair protein RecO (recombination protein O)
MPRDTQRPSIVLRTRDSGESNKIVTFFSPDQGIFDAMMYGGPKSKLRSLASPFHAGTAYIYHDPVRDSNKLSDFDLKDSWPSVRESIEKAWTASLWAEFMIKTHGTGGNFVEQFALLLDAFAGLEAAPPAEAAYPSAVFLWKSLGRMGVRPDPRRCAACGGAISENDVPWFDEASVSFLCGPCAAGLGGAYRVLGGAARFIEAAAALPFKEASRRRLEPGSLAAAKRMVHAVARVAALGELKTLAAGEGIL